MKALHCTAFVLVIIGGLNWGLIGIGGFINANWNIIAVTLGSSPTLEWLVYVLVGLSAVVLVATHKSDCRHCMSGSSGMGGMQ